MEANGAKVRAVGILVLPSDRCGEGRATGSGHGVDQALGVSLWFQQPRQGPISDDALEAEDAPLMRGEVDIVLSLADGRTRCGPAEVTGARGLTSPRRKGADRADVIDTESGHPPWLLLALLVLMQRGHARPYAATTTPGNECRARRRVAPGVCRTGRSRVVYERGAPGSKTQAVARRKW